jgi:hypothetical protein
MFVIPLSGGQKQEARDPISKHQGLGVECSSLALDLIPNTGKKNVSFPKKMIKEKCQTLTIEPLCKPAGCSLLRGAQPAEVNWSW